MCVPLIYITQCYLMKAIFVTNVFGEYGSNKTRSTVIENGFLLFGKTLYGREWPVYGKHKFWKDHTFWSPAVVFPILVQFFKNNMYRFFLQFCNSYTFPFWIYINIKLILWYIYWKDVVQQKASIKYHILFFEKLNQFGNDVNANTWCLD